MNTFKNYFIINNKIIKEEILFNIIQYYTFSVRYNIYIELVIIYEFWKIELYSKRIL